jgi:hypothetical protein
VNTRGIGAAHTLWTFGDVAPVLNVVGRRPA